MPRPGGRGQEPRCQEGCAPQEPGKDLPRPSLGGTPTQGEWQGTRALCPPCGASLCPSAVHPSSRTPGQAQDKPYFLGRHHHPLPGRVMFPGSVGFRLECAFWAVGEVWGLTSDQPSLGLSAPENHGTAQGAREALRDCPRVGAPGCMWVWE